MTSKQKAEQLFSIMQSTCKSKADAKMSAIVVCDEILNTKNYPNTLHPDMTNFSNAYWKGVIEEIHKL